jgi:hypothetical protein
MKFGSNIHITVEYTLYSYTLFFDAQYPTLTLYSASMLPFVSDPLLDTNPSLEES